MWDAIVPLGPGYDPIIHEGSEAANVIVHNAGPCSARLRTWDSITTEGKPQIDLQLRPGATRSIVGKLIRVALDEGGPSLNRPYYAAIAWRIVR